jgi:hypothetical protein
MKKVYLLPLLFLFITACQKENIETGSANNEQLQGKRQNKIDITVNGLMPLDSNLRYEGWLIVGGNPVSTGTFKVNKRGRITPPQQITNTNDLQSATAFVITVEPFPDPNPAPSDMHILAGDFTGNTASLTVGHMAALGDDFTSAMGKFLLATPTDGPNTNENSGIWFIDNTSGTPMAGLSLPTLPTGWIYEGWDVMNGIPVTTGKFLVTNAADMDAPYSGSLPGPPFPGEDYLMNAPAGLTFPTDLSDTKVVITIEPYPDNNPSPFFLKPISGDVPANAVPMTSYPLMNSASSLPTGTVTR